MGLMLLKKFNLLFLLISSSLLSSSFAGGRSIKNSPCLCFNGLAGGRSKLISNLAADVDPIQEEERTPRKQLNEEEVSIIHERLLRANARDYGKYDPTPALSKPPSKLIPN